MHVLNRTPLQRKWRTFQIDQDIFLHSKPSMRHITRVQLSLGQHLDDGSVFRHIPHTFTIVDETTHEAVPFHVDGFVLSNVGSYVIFYKYVPILRFGATDSHEVAVSSTKVTEILLPNVSIPTETVAPLGQNILIV